MIEDRHKVFLAMVDALRATGLRDDKQIREKINESPSNFSTLISGKRTVTPAILEKMYKAFPKLKDLDYSQMVVHPDHSEIVHNRKLIRPNTELIPYYEEDFFAGNAKEIDTPNSAPAYYMDINVFKGCIAFRAYGDSMAKLIQSGTILFAKKIEEWKEHLEFGQIYGIVMKDGRKYLKYIQPVANNKKAFTLESHNKHYAPFEVPKEKIHNIWLVEGWLNKTA